MLTDTTLKNLRPQAAMYKAADREGMYVTVSPAGTITFRYHYRINGRHETLTIGRYGPAGLTLARTRERCMEARRSVSEGVSPAQETQIQKRQIAQSQTFGEFVTRWSVEARMADSTRSMRQSILEEMSCRLTVIGCSAKSAPTTCVSCATRSRRAERLPRPCMFATS